MCALTDEASGEAFLSDLARSLAAAAGPAAAAGRAGAGSAAGSTGDGLHGAAAAAPAGVGVGAGPSARALWGAVLLADIAGSVRAAQELLLDGGGGLSALAGSGHGQRTAGFDGARAADLLSRKLNAATQKILRVARAFDGDVLKFLGDACLVLLPCEGASELPGACRRGLQIARELLAPQAAPPGEIERDRELGDPFQLHVALAAGPLAALTLGGVSGKLELTDSRSMARGGAGSHRAAAAAAAAAAAGTLARLAPFLPRDVERVLTHGGRFFAEMRVITCAFVLLPTAPGTPGSDAATPAEPRPPDLEELEALDRRVRVVQGAAERSGGVVRSFFRDDKGFVGMVTWGLVGSSHPDDPSRACSAAVRIRDEFAEGGLGRVSVGVCTGRVFAGLVGDSSRCDYTVLGASVNLAARLMAAADGAVLIDRMTHDTAKSEFEAEATPPLTVREARPRRHSEAGLTSTPAATAVAPACVCAQVKGHDGPVEAFLLVRRVGGRSWRKVPSSRSLREMDGGGGGGGGRRQSSSSVASALRRQSRQAQETAPTANGAHAFEGSASASEKYQSASEGEELGAGSPVRPRPSASASDPAAGRNLTISV
eukprot:tig00021179_g19299.t1